MRGLTRSVCDGADPEAVATLFAAATAALGGLDALVNNAGAGARNDAVFASKAALREVPPEVVRAEAPAKTSLGRLVSTDDIANAIVFLASPLGANISGHALPVDADTQALV